MEDETAILNIIKAFLKDAGYLIFLAEDEAARIAVVHEGQPDLVLLNLLWLHEVTVHPAMRTLSGRLPQVCRLCCFESQEHLRLPQGVPKAGIGSHNSPSVQTNDSQFLWNILWNPRYLGFLQMHMQHTWGSHPESCASSGSPRTVHPLHEG
ncbi:MAG: response regulator [Lachnospiraceae bacterium]|nr:response regulator [Lachnospiraceae bacterium]